MPRELTRMSSRVRLRKIQWTQRPQPPRARWGPPLLGMIYLCAVTLALLIERGIHVPAPYALPMLFALPVAGGLAIWYVSPGDVRGLSDALWTAGNGSVASMGLFSIYCGLTSGSGPWAITATVWAAVIAAGSYAIDRHNGHALAAATWSFALLCSFFLLLEAPYFAIIAIARLA